MIYGKEDKNSLGLLFKLIKKCPLVPVISNGNQKLQPVYVGDVVKAIITCLNIKQKNKTYLIAGPEEIDFNQIINITSKILSKKRIKLHIPLFLFLLASLFRFGFKRVAMTPTYRI